MLWQYNQLSLHKVLNMFFLLKCSNHKVHVWNPLMPIKVMIKYSQELLYEYLVRVLMLEVDHQNIQQGVWGCCMKSIYQVEWIFWWNSIVWNKIQSLINLMMKLSCFSIVILCWPEITPKRCRSRILCQNFYFWKCVSI